MTTHCLLSDCLLSDNDEDSTGNRGTYGIQAVLSIAWGRERTSASHNEREGAAAYTNFIMP
ncbi:MAG: hypothetical protein H7Z11_03765 [Verrucomicrobia bacterium]|nr:hypothetical protein [Leptolyngbya sp. ES-bin-22]